MFCGLVPIWGIICSHTTRLVDHHRSECTCPAMRVGDPQEKRWVRHLPRVETAVQSWCSQPSGGRSMSVRVSRLKPFWIWRSIYVPLNDGHPNGPERRNEKVMMKPRWSQGSRAIVCALVADNDMNRRRSFYPVSGTSYIVGNVTLPSGFQSWVTRPTNGYAISCQQSDHW